MRTFFGFTGILCLCALFFSCSMFAGDLDDGASLSAISFDKTSLAVAQGGMDMLSIRVDPAGLQSSLSLSWEFDPSVISVARDNFNAVVTGLQAGSTALRVTAEGITASCLVSVSSDYLSPDISFPYLYVSADLVKLSPGSTERVDASLFGGLPSDMSGFSFSIDKPSVASLHSEGNYLWITGQNEGEARITARHSKAAFAYTFLVSCRADGRDVPFITTASNFISINKSLDNSAVLSVDLRHPLSNAYTQLFSFAITGADGSALSNPPVSIAASSNMCVITPLSPGECLIRVQHDQALYPLSVLVRVSERISAVHIETSSSLVQLAANASETLSVSLEGLPPAADPPSADFEWSVPDNGVIEASVFNGSSEGKGDRLWITGKKHGAVKITVSHPLSPLPRDIVVMVSNTAEAAAASTYITTGQNFIRMKAGDADTAISITINNAPSGAEADLFWHVDNSPADGSDNPVIAFAAASGSFASSSSRSAAFLTPSATGFASVSPLRAGSAVITISHPKALYATKILVSVLDAAAQDAPSLLLSSALPLPYLTLKNGESASLAVSLSGSGKTPADDSAIQWSASQGLSLSANAANASVTALGSGLSRETVTASHPSAVLPVEFAILRYDSAEQLDSAKTLLLPNRFRALHKGAQDYLSAVLLGAQEGDSLSWTVASGLNSVIAFEQESNSGAKITALSRGSATVRVSFGGENSSFEITVTDDGLIDPSKPAYLSAADNVTLLSAGETADIRIIPVNIPAALFSGLLWRTSDDALIDIAPNGASASVTALAEGKARITVSHPSSANSLELFVHIGDQFEFKQSPAYISTSSDTLSLRAGGEAVLLRPVLASAGGAELQTQGFSFSVRDPSILAVEAAASSSAILSPKAPGQTIVTVSHQDAAFPKDIIAIVDSEAGNTPYITTSQNVIAVSQGESAFLSAAIANAGSFSPSDWSWSVKDVSVASIAASGAGSALITGNSPGTTLVSVSNKNAPLPLSVIVITLDKRAAEAAPWIKTSANIVTVKKGSSQTIAADMIGASQAAAAAFLWSTADALTALVTPSQNQAAVRGVKTGQTYVTVRNSAFPDAYPKSVLVIVEDTPLDECSISLSRQTLKMKPDDKNGAVVNASLLNGSPLDAQNFIWWADDYNIVSLSSLTDTAQITPTGRSGSTAVHVKHPKALYAADVMVLVGAFDSFAFSHPSLSLAAGAVSFLPMQIPPLSGAFSVSYQSANQAVAAVSGSSATALIAGVGQGSTTVTATLSNASGVIASSDIAVIVSPPSPNANAVSSPSSLLTVEFNQSAPVSARLDGPDALPADNWNLSWLSSDPSVIALTANGESAILSAKSPGEAVVSISHPKAPSPFNIWVTVPPVKEKTLSLDHAYIEMFRNEGNATITAAVYNGSSADYNAISWSAPRQGGAQIVSLMNTSGKTCTIIPRNAGVTTLSAQLPDGQKAECVVNVISDALLALSAQTVRVNPRYAETVSYTVTPENAAVSWFAQADDAVGHSAVFDYSVNAADKTISISGNSLGSGTISGYVASTSGAKMVSLRVYVEHTYSFSFANTPYRSTRPPDAPFTCAFKVFPPDLKVAVSSSRPDILIVPPYATVDPLTGLGSVTATPIGEAADVVLSFASYHQGAAAPIPEASGERRVDVMYDDYQFSGVFDIQAGSFSRYENDRLYLGDGEEFSFSVFVTNKNAAPLNVRAEWSKPDGDDSLDTRGDTANGGKISLVEEASNRFRVKHATDHTSGDFFLITKDLYYTMNVNYDAVVSKDILNDNGTVIGSKQEVVTQTNASTRYSAKNGQGITSWRAEHGNSTSGWSASSNPFLRVAGSSNNFKEIVDYWLMSNRATSSIDNYPLWEDKDKITSSAVIGSYTPPAQGASSQDLYRRGSISFSYETDDAFKPYIMSGQAFRGNPNYYRQELSERRHHWDLAGDHYGDTYYFRETILHRFAFPTPTKKTDAAKIEGGSITILYTLANGVEKPFKIPVTFERRECEAYSAGMWIEDGKGGWTRK